MELEGTVQNGVVVLATDSSLPEGTRVKVIVPDSAQSVVPTHYVLFRDIIGQAQGLPEDMASNHSYFIRGGPPAIPPKRSLLERLGDVVGKVEGLPPDASQNVDQHMYGHPKE